MLEFAYLSCYAFGGCNRCSGTRTADVEEAIVLRSAALEEKRGQASESLLLAPPVESTLTPSSWAGIL